MAFSIWLFDCTVLPIPPNPDSLRCNLKNPCANLSRFTLLLAFLFLAAVFPVAAFAQDSSQNPGSQQEHHPARGTVQGQLKSVVGTICKGEDGELLLRDSSKGLYWIDDQSLARKYMGKSVEVTGVLDAADNLIRILKIQSAM